MSYNPYGAPGGFPPQANNLYQPGYHSQPGYPPQPAHPQPGYPSQPGYPPQPAHPQPGYPSQVAYPPQPSHTQPGYPSQVNYPPQPAHSQPGYPSLVGFPPQPAYPQSGYPSQVGYPQPAYPQSGYPPQVGCPQPAYPQPGYPQVGFENSIPTPHLEKNFMNMNLNSIQATQLGNNFSSSLPSIGLTANNSNHPTQGTVRAASLFNPEEDSKTLRKAMKGIGTDEKAIISVLSARSNTQRVEIKNRFKTMYGKDLLTELKSELSGNFESCILALMVTPIEYDADQLRAAMKGIGTDEGALIEILSTRNNQQIQNIRQTYKQRHNRDLEKDLISETSGHFKRLCVSLCQGNRNEGMSVNLDKARKDAQDLYQAGEKMLGTDESKFNSILCSESYEQINLIMKEYQKLSKKSLEQAIKSEMSGDLENGMIAILKVAENLQGFFAQRLYHSMKGLGTRDSTLIRIIVSRCEVDMVQIKQELQKQYGQTLKSMIEGDTSGDYKRILLALVQ